MAVRICLVLGACDGGTGLGPELPGGPVVPPPPPPPSGTVPVALVRVSASHQVGMVASSMPDPFVVRAVDASGVGVPGVTVRWEVTGLGAICFHTPSECHVGSWPPLVTGNDGTSRVWHRPLALGPGSITARVDGLSGSPMTFTMEATGILIRFSPLFDCTGPDDPVRFERPQGPNPVTVTVGTPVTWEYMAWVHPGCVAEIVSVRVPAGGASFASGWLTPGMRFHFIPSVPGTWVYADRFSGGADSIIVIPSPAGGEEQP